MKQKKWKEARQKNASQYKSLSVWPRVNARALAQEKQNDCYSHWKLLSILSTPLNCHFVLLFAFVHWFFFCSLLFCARAHKFIFLNWLNTVRARARLRSLSLTQVHYLFYYSKFGAEFTIDDDHFNHTAKETKQTKTLKQRRKKNPTTLRKIKLMKKSSKATTKWR